MSRIFWLNAAVIRKKEDRVPLDRLFAEHTQTGAFRNIKLFSALPLTKPTRPSPICIGYYHTVLHQCVQQW